eukprot:8668146-Ditylum_brightwellii.AAC.1
MLYGGVIFARPPAVATVLVVVCIGGKLGATEGCTSGLCGTREGASSSLVRMACQKNHPTRM